MNTGADDPVETAELGPLSARVAAAAAAEVVHPHVDVAALSHAGHVRTTNEDHYLVARFGRFLEPLLTNVPPEQSAGLFEEGGYGLVVADGMGGAAAGDVASALAIQTLLELVRATPDWILSSQRDQAQRVMERMAKRYHQIDERLRATADENPELEGMGTTMTLAASFGASMVLAHVGDSRAYLFRAGRLHRLTHDHTVAQEMLDMGLVDTRKDVAASLRHALTRALGGKSSLTDVDVDQLTLAHRDTILIATDGLSGMIDDETITAILQGAATADAACQTLVNAALAAGGRDNVTVVVTHYRFQR